MKDFLAREAFVVVIDGEETSGLIVYGLGARRTLARRGSNATCALGSIADDWLLVGEHWEVAMWTIPISSWPTGQDWQRRLTDTLQAMIESGARVAWIGAETMAFADPPFLFLPEYFARAVPAWMTDDGRQGGHLDPDEPFVPATDAELREYATGLADVG